MLKPGTYDQANKDRDNHLCGLLRASRNYVQAFAENEDAHPQARDDARQLSAQIKVAIG